MRNRWSVWSLWIILVAALTALIMHSYLGSFSRFIADDYCSAAEANKLGVFRAAWFWYITWTGRYSANLLDAIFGVLGPFFTPLVTMLILIIWLTALGSVFYLLLSPERETKERTLISTALAVSILFLTLTLTPNVRESIYWGQGMRSVVPPLILGTGYVLAFLWYKNHTWSTRSSIFWMISGLALSFGAGGFSETYTVFQLSAFLLALGFLIITKRSTSQKNIFLFILLGFLGAMVSLLTVIRAPGNPFRQAYFPPPPPAMKLLTIAIQSFGAFWVGLFGSPDKILGLVGTIAIGIFAGTLINSKYDKASTPFFVMLFGMGLVFSCFPPSAYGLSDAPPDRTLVIPIYGLVLILFLFGISLEPLLSRWIQVGPPASIASALIIVVVAGISVNQMTASLNIYINYALAWQQFHTQMLAYHRAGLNNVQISTQKMNDNNWSGLDVLGDNPKFFVNKCVSNYYGFKTVISSTPPNP
jgi:Family of unknown function (DUF6056)